MDGTAQTVLQEQSCKDGATAMPQGCRDGAEGPGLSLRSVMNNTSPAMQTRPPGARKLYHTTLNYGGSGLHLRCLNMRYNSVG